MANGSKYMIPRHSWPCYKVSAAGYRSWVLFTGIFREPAAGSARKLRQIAGLVVHLIEQGLHGGKLGNIAVLLSL